jgi:hypothetical protein
MGRGCMGNVPPPVQYYCRRHRGRRDCVRHGGPSGNFVSGRRSQDGPDMADHRKTNPTSRVISVGYRAGGPTEKESS